MTTRAFRFGHRLGAGALPRASGPRLSPVVILALLLVGCASQDKKNPYQDIRGPQAIEVRGAPQIDPTVVPTHDDVVQIMRYLRDPIFVWDADRPTGVAMSVYLISSETQKGVFGRGPIEVDVFELRRSASGVDRRRVHTWKLSESEAMGFRVRKRSVLGYYYGLLLKWPKELDLVGREIELVISYTRSDGRVVNAAPVRRRVPAPLGYTPPRAISRG